MPPYGPAAVVQQPVASQFAQKRHHIRAGPKLLNIDTKTRTNLIEILSSSSTSAMTKYFTVTTCALSINHNPGTSFV